MRLLYDQVMVLPVARIVFDDFKEFSEFEDLALELGMGNDWPVAMLRNYLESYKESHQVGNKPFSWNSAA